jgi:peptidoglycan/LPS O-acetylase OafA/YrhL
MAVSAEQRGRIVELDGLRGLAILLVVGFHYFGRFTAERGVPLYPYGDSFASWPIASDGRVGVFLFFIISGLVIRYSLDRSRSTLHFLAKRADRLVLPMLVLSTITFGLLAGPLQTRFLEVGWADFLPSWTFTAPGLWRWVDPQVGYIDTAYWTLFVEIRFYLLAGLLWFLAPRRHLLNILVALACGGFLALLLFEVAGWRSARALVEVFLFPRYLPLFVCGWLYADLLRNRADGAAWRKLWLLIPFSLAGVASNFNGQWSQLLWVVAFHLIFVGLVQQRRWVTILRTPLLVGLGLVSYSLYLIHQAVGVALISRLPSEWSLVAQLAGVAGVTVLMIGVACLSWRLLEQRRPFTARKRPVTNFGV